MTKDNRPQDENLDGAGLKFETLEHGGSLPDCFPNVVKITDGMGRSCSYAPIQESGEDVISHGFHTLQNVDRKACQAIDDALLSGPNNRNLTADEPSK